VTTEYHFPGLNCCASPPLAMPTAVTGAAALAEHYQDVTLLFEGRRHPTASKMRMGLKRAICFSPPAISRGG
jgi:hypothetical protein